MSDKGDKSLEEFESSQCNYAKGGLMFCMSPPPRNKTGRKKKSENQGDGTNNDLKGPVKDRVIRKKDAHAGKPQNKPDRPTVGRTKGEAFCISPPVPKRASVNKSKIQDVQRPQIIEQFRNGRINALQSSPRQPLKAVHSINNGREENEISSSTIAGQTNEKMTTKAGYKSDGYTNGKETANPENKTEGHANDTQTPKQPDESTGAVNEPQSDCYTDETDGKTTNRDDEKSKTQDEKGQGLATTGTQDEKEKEREEAQARFMLSWKKSFDQNRSEIQKLREQVNKAKEGISKMCEEEENWKCRLEMQKGVVNASLRKIEHKKEENPFWFSGVNGAEPTMEKLKSSLTESREDLVYQLSRVRRVTQEAVKEKVMERRRLGESYPKRLLSNFRKAFSKYSSKHLFNDSLIQPVCPKLDIIVPLQKRPDNSRRYYKVLIDGRHFNYKKIGLTQVMGLMNEEVDRDGKLELNVPMKTMSNETEFKIAFRKPHHTKAIDVEIIRENGCDASIISLVDEKMLDEPKLSPSLHTSVADRITGFKADSEPPTNKSASINFPQPASSPKLPQTETTTFRRNNQNITQKVKENTARANENRAKSKPHSADGAGEDGASYTSPLSAQYKPPKSVGYVLVFDESKPPRQQTLLEQLCGHKPIEGEEFSSFGDGESNNIVQPIAVNISKANIQKHNTPHNINQMEPGEDKKVKDTREEGFSISTGKVKRSETAGSDSWQHGHSVLPPIGQSMEDQTVEEEITKCKINTTLGDKKASIQCDLDVIPVKVPHRTPLSNVVTYVTTLVRKDTIIPLSLVRQGSLIPICIPKHGSQRKFERRGRVDGCNNKGAKKSSLSRSSAKNEGNDTMGSRSWQRHSVLPSIGKTAKHQKMKKKKITKRVTNLKLGDRTVYVVCETNMIPVKVLHRSPPSNDVTHVVTLVEKDIIIPFSLARQESLIPICPQYIKQDIRVLLQREQNQPHMQNVQNRRYLYTIQERSQEFDDGFYGSPTYQVPLPFASYQDDQPNSPLGSYPQDDINAYSAAMEYEMQYRYTLDTPYRQGDSSPEIPREASIVSLGFTPGWNIDDVTEVRTEESPKEDEETNDKGDGRLQEADEDLVTDWSAFFSTRNSNANCCGYSGSSNPACADDSNCSKVLVPSQTSTKNPATNSNSRRCQVLAPHPPSTKRPATATYRRRSFVKARS